ncbi:hypothetical protein KJ903_00275 [Patescibacteria group bacterium]|nr:hypothetical protein [Patescibacteria group bacterium]
MSIENELKQRLLTVFQAIPADKILALAVDVQQKLQNDQSLEQQAKGDDEWGWVTKADKDIQALLVEYFAQSDLAGTYIVKAEEELEGEDIPADPKWQLIIDPLDGTSAYRKGKETWGVMVGACDREGKLIISWNMVSTGEVYMSGTEQGERLSFADKITAGQAPAIDVYDYKSGAAEKFGELFTKQTGYKTNQYEQTSYPAAVWAGWQLYQGNLDGLLWVPSGKGKKWYPDYDMIFVGALLQRGLQTRLGKLDDNIALVVVAPSQSDVEDLTKVGLAMMTDEQRNILEVIDSDLSTTSAIK